MPTASELNIGDLPLVADYRVGWNDAYDALIHVGGGKMTSLERVALQMEGSSLFVDTFTRAMEALGHVEVLRDERLEPKEWVVAPPYLAELVDNSLLLTGAWTPSQRVRLAELVADIGGQLTMSPAEEWDGGVSGPPRWLVLGADTRDVAAIVGEAAAAGVVPDAGRRLLRVLPPLGDVLAALSRIPMPSARRILRFDLSSASWAPAGDAAQPGAYRLLAAFSSREVFRDSGDLEREEVAVGTVQLVKHLEARRAGRALVAYDPAAARLAVPLGADLPGLYGRALVLCSGRLPTPIPKRRCLVYHDVPRDVADLLTTLLTT